MRKQRKLRVCAFCGNSRPCDDVRWFKVGKGKGIKVFAYADCRRKVNARQVAVEALVGNMRDVNRSYCATQPQRHIRRQYANSVGNQI